MFVLCQALQKSSLTVKRLRHIAIFEILIRLCAPPPPPPPHTHTGCCILYKMGGVFAFEPIHSCRELEPLGLVFEAKLRAGVKFLRACLMQLQFQLHLFWSSSITCGNTYLCRRKASSVNIGLISDEWTYPTARFIFGLVVSYHPSWMTLIHDGS